MDWGDFSDSASDTSGGVPESDPEDDNDENFLLAPVLTAPASPSIQPLPLCSWVASSLSGSTSAVPVAHTPLSVLFPLTAIAITFQSASAALANMQTVGNQITREFEPTKIYSKPNEKVSGDAGKLRNTLICAEYK
ncbi:hypothetical protein B0H14DRAFT_2612861 [Mycena olivaceomarginata]|nr:hypothetical protein B0H14DRAFT_2612861 [Mycena olivaceomarginata]